MLAIYIYFYYYYHANPSLVFIFFMLMPSVFPGQFKGGATHKVQAITHPLISAARDFGN